ncbi:MAG: radical SAM protein [Clostridia bacterium]|nr:radical SAM protein [Clostridia bacterium]
MESTQKQQSTFRRKNQEPPFIRYLYRKAAATGTPLSGTFELTPRCNFDCKMCYVHLTKGQQCERGRELTADEWLSIADDAVRSGLVILLVTGGEPLLRPDFKEIFRTLNGMGLVTGVNTNGSLIDDDMISFFKCYTPNRMNISLYGASPETYERLCGNADGFYKTIRAIKKLAENNIPTKINLSVTPYNVDDVEAVFGITKELGKRVQIASYMFPPIRRSHDLIGYGDRLSPEEAARIKVRVQSIRTDDEAFLNLCKSVMDGVRVIDEDAECMDVPTLEDATPTEHIRCRAGSTSYWLTWDGRMLPCGMMETPSASVLELGFKEAWKRVAMGTKQIFLPPKCTSCDKRFACEVCSASCYCETGAFDKDAPKYHCEFTKHYIKLIGAEYERLTALLGSDK